MKNRDDSMEWIPLWIDKWIFGSTRIELQPDERSVWVDLMAIASKDNGYIRANPETEYPPQQLAGLLCISEELLNRSIQRFIETKKIAKSENGAGYYILNWATYQLSDRHKRRFEENLSGDLIGTGNLNLEKILKERIIKELQVLNVNYEIEKICKTGRIDIFINADPPKIIEVKGSEYADSIRAGIRQLLEYGIEFPQSILYLAIPNPQNLHIRIKEKLKEYKINLYPCPSDSHHVQSSGHYRRGEERIGEDRIGKDRILREGKPIFLSPLEKKKKEKEEIERKIQEYKEKEKPK